MNYIYKVPVVVLNIGLSFAVAMSAQAQKINKDPICYVGRANGSVIDLTRLCGGEVMQRTLSIEEQQAQFLKDFYQQLRGNPNEQDVIAQADPDTLIGKANQVCNALRDGTYEPPVRPKDEPDSRKVISLEEAIVDQIARQHFCPNL